MIDDKVRIKCTKCSQVFRERAQKVRPNFQTNCAHCNRLITFDFGSEARRVGQPHDQHPWQWLCGFYPGSSPGEQQGGTPPTFEQARANFEVAWQVFSARRTPPDYQAWRDQRDWTARKYAMWDRGERLSSE